MAQISDKTALVLLAKGSEEIETVGVVDILRRGSVKVTLATIEKDLIVECSRGVKLVADALLESIQNVPFDVIVIPGGGDGARALAAHELVLKMLKAQKAASKHIAAICAAPALVLAGNGLVDDITTTCYPSLWTKLPSCSTSRVCVDGCFITSQGPGTTLHFGLQILESLVGKVERDKVAKATLVCESCSIEC